MIDLYDDPNVDDLRAQDAWEKRRRADYCRCGNRNMPGTCPGWSKCPMNEQEIARDACA